MSKRSLIIEFKEVGIYEITRRGIKSFLYDKKELEKDDFHIFSILNEVGASPKITSKLIDEDNKKFYLASHIENLKFLNDLININSDQILFDFLVDKELIPSPKEAYNRESFEEKSSYLSVVSLELNGTKAFDRETGFSSFFLKMIDL